MWAFEDSVFVISKAQLAFGAATLTLLALGAISYRAISPAGDSDRWVRHTHELLENLQGLLVAMEGGIGQSWIRADRRGLLSPLP